MSGHVETTQRAVIIEKKLMWAILLTVVTSVGGGGLWVGTTVTTLVRATEELSRSLANESEVRTDAIGAEREARRAMAARVEALERTEGRTDQRLINLSEGVSRVERGQTQTNSLLSEVIQKLNNGR